MAVITAGKILQYKHGHTEGSELAKKLTSAQVQNQHIQLTRSQLQWFHLHLEIARRLKCHLLRKKKLRKIFRVKQSNIHFQLILT